jgi:hypothetical protein
MQQLKAEALRRKEKGQGAADRAAASVTILVRNPRSTEIPPKSCPILRRLVCLDPGTSHPSHPNTDRR